MCLSNKSGPTKAKYVHTFKKTLVEARFFFFFHNSDNYNLQELGRDNLKFLDDESKARLSVPKKGIYLFIYLRN